MRKTRIFADIVREAAGAQLNAEGATSLDKIIQESDQAIELIASVQRFLESVTIASLGPAYRWNQIIDSAESNVRLHWSDWKLEVSELPAVFGRVGQLQNLFEELLQNAVKFRHPERPLRVTITHRIIQQNSYQQLENRYRYADFVQLEIADNGLGFDPKYRDYAFELLKN